MKNYSTLSVILIFGTTFLFFQCTSKKKPADTNNRDQQEVSVEEESQTEPTRVIVFFGNSLTAGYRLEEGADFPSLIQKKLDSLDMNYKVVNAGLSGETTAGGVSRIDWILNQPMDVFVLELGANDMLRGFDLKSTRENLSRILSKVKESKPDVKLVLAGMQAPPNLGQDYSRQFQSLYPELAEEFDATLIPFLLDGVASKPELNLEDGVHPNEKGQHIVAENVWKELKTIL